MRGQHQSSEGLCPMSRKTFDSSEYYAARNAFDGYCLGCGKKIGFTIRLILTKRGELRKEIPNRLMVCNGTCERAFIDRAIKDWSKVRDEVFERDNYTCQDCGKSERIKFIKKRYPVEPIRLSEIGLLGHKAAQERFDRTAWRCVWKLVKEQIPLEVHHIIPISEGGPEFDLDNLVTLCFECHHLGRHGSKRAEDRQRAEIERLQNVRSRHITLEWFVGGVV